MDISAFQLQGKTITFTANTSGNVPAPVQTAGDAGNSPSCYIVSNRGTVDVFMTCESTSALATTNAVIPTGTPQRCHVIPANSQVSIKGPANAFFTGITASGTAVVYVSPGEGL